MARLNDYSVILPTPIETSSTRDPVAYVEQIKNSAGITLLQLIGAAGAPAADLEKSVFLSNSGDDGNDGLNPAEPVKTWAKAYQLALGGSETKVIQIPDASVFTVTHYSSAVTVHGFNGARLIGDFTPKGEWYVTYLGDHTAATKNTITLGEGLKIVCSEIHANLQDANSNYSSLTYTVANELDGELTLRGTGVLNFFIPIVTGKITINDEQRVYGLLLGKIYGADFTHLLGHFLGLTAHQGTFDTLTVTGDIINSALNSRLDLISRSRLEASADVIPAGEALGLHQAVTVVDTASGPRYYWAKDRAGDDNLVARDIYTADQVTNNLNITTAALDTNVTGGSSTNAKTHVELDPGTLWGALVWGDDATNNIRARIVAKDPATGHMSALLTNNVGNAFAEYSISTTKEGDVNALAVAWGKRRDKDLWIFASLGASKEVYACKHQVVDSGTISNFGTWFKLPFVYEADSLAVVYDVSRDSFHIGQYSAADHVFVFQNFQLLVEEDAGTGAFDYHTHRISSGRVNSSRVVGVPPSNCISSLGITMHGDDVLLVVPTDKNGEVVLYRIGTDVNGSYEPDRSTSSPIPIAGTNEICEEWGMGSDGVELYFAAASGSLDSNLNPVYNLVASFFVEDLLMKPVDIVYNVMNDSNVTHFAVAVNSVAGSSDPQSIFSSQAESTIEILAVDQAQHAKIYKTQFNLPTPTTSHKKPVGITKVAALPGEPPLVAGNGEKVGGWTNRITGENYYLFASGAMDIDSQNTGKGVTIYQALTPTTVLVKISADSERISQSEEGLRTTREDIFAIERTQANLVAGEQIDVYRFLHMDDGQPGELFHARSTATLPHDPAKMALYSTFTQTTPDAYTDEAFSAELLRTIASNFVKDAAIACTETRAIFAVATSANKIHSAVIDASVVDSEDNAYWGHFFETSGTNTYAASDLAIATGSLAAGLQVELTSDDSAVIFNRSSANGSIRAQVLAWDSEDDSVATSYFHSDSTFNAYDSRLLFHNNRLFGMFVGEVLSTRTFSIKSFQLGGSSRRFMGFDNVVSEVDFTTSIAFQTFAEHEFGLVGLGDRMAAIYSGDNGEVHARWVDIDAQGDLSLGSRSNASAALTFTDLRFWSAISFGYTIAFVGIHWSSATRGRVDMHFYRLNTTKDGLPEFVKANEPLVNIFDDTSTGHQAIPRATYNPKNHAIEIVQYMTTGHVRKTQIKMGVTNRSLRPIVGYTNVEAAAGEKVILSTRGQVVHLPKDITTAKAGDIIAIDQDGTVEIKGSSTQATAVDVIEAIDNTYGVLTYPLGTS